MDELRASATEFLPDKGRTQEGGIVMFSTGVPVGVSYGASRIKVVKVEGAG